MLLEVKSAHWGVGIIEYPSLWRTESGFFDARESPLTTIIRMQQSITLINVLLRPNTAFLLFIRIVFSNSFICLIIVIENS
jgi:hypothetical protein